MQSPPPLPRAASVRPRWLLPFLLIFASTGLISFGLIMKRAYLQAAAGIQGVRTQTDVAIIQSHLLHIRTRAQIYFRRFPERTEVTWKELKASEPSQPDLKSAAGENYDDVVVRKGNPFVSLALPDGRVIALNR